MQSELIFEIGTEELPARFVKTGLVEFKRLAVELMTKERLEYEEIRTFGTPRRLVLCVRGLANKQEDMIKEVRGPSKKVAIDEHGDFTRAAQGFARSQGVDTKDLIVKRTPQGEYVFVILKEEGRETIHVLEELLPNLVKAINFPKSMRWGDTDIRFARPIRWLMSLYGEEVVYFTLDGLGSGNITFGHRQLSEGAYSIKSTDEYFKTLKEAYCILDQDRRRQMIVGQITKAASTVGGSVLFDEELIDEVTFLVEYPSALCGGFDLEFLKIPAEVLITTMKEHQRYFPVVDDNGSLMAAFIAIRNGGQEYIDIVRAGNERVLKARLSDARFFYEEDKRLPLSERVQELSGIIFHEALGTMAEKVNRVSNLASYIGESFGLDIETLKKINRIALLCKADLVTNMVREFPELQGQMGREYARLSGEDSAVAEGIFESYLPRFSGDVLPKTDIGRVVSLADKFDSIVGTFGIGLIPTGSKDPYALRRQTLGILNILMDARCHVQLSHVIGKALELYEDSSKITRNTKEINTDLMEFFKQRLAGLLQERGFKHDVVEAVLAAGFDDVVQTLDRAQALNDVMSTSEFLNLITAITRADRISKGVTPSEIDPSFFTDEAENDLYKEYIRCKDEINNIIATSQDSSNRFLKILSTLATLRGPVDRFFDDVMVMVEDETIRGNRLSLIRKVADLSLLVADLSKISYE